MFEITGGTDRLAEVAAALECDVVVNVQGDEPLLAPETIDAAVGPGFPTMTVVVLSGIKGGADA